MRHLGATKTNFVASTRNDTGTLTGSPRPSSTRTSKLKVPLGSGCHVILPFASIVIPLGAPSRLKSQLFVLRVHGHHGELERNFGGARTPAWARTPLDALPHLSVDVEVFQPNPALAVRSHRRGHRRPRRHLWHRWPLSVSLSCGASEEVSTLCVSNGASTAPASWVDVSSTSSTTAEGVLPPGPSKGIRGPVPCQGSSLAILVCHHLGRSRSMPRATGIDLTCFRGFGLLCLREAEHTRWRFQGAIQEDPCRFIRTSPASTVRTWTGHTKEHTYGLGRAIASNLLLMVAGILNCQVGVMVLALSEKQQRVGDMPAKTLVVRKL